MGFSLRDILRERMAVGTLAEDPDEFARRAIAAARDGKKFTHVFELSDGRKIAVNNEPRPSGGWVSTHEDISERMQAAQERTAPRSGAAPGAGGRRHRRLSPADGKPHRQRQRQCRRHAQSASSLFNSSRQTSQRAAGAVGAFDEASANVKIVTRRPRSCHRRSPRSATSSCK